MLPLETVGEGEEEKAFIQSRKMDVCVSRWPQFK